MCAQVRGAYVKLERARAAELGYEDPIWPNIDATHANFNRCLDAILDEVRCCGRPCFVGTAACVLFANTPLHSERPAVSVAAN